MPQTITIAVNQQFALLAGQQGISVPQALAMFMAYVAKEQRFPFDIAEGDTGRDILREEREAMWREALDAERHFRQTGAHLSHEEVTDWIGRTAAGSRPASPKCHT